VDQLWAAIVDHGGEESMCGWCKDRWGVSWQIIPKALGEMLGHSDPVVAKRAFEAMMTMRKIQIDGLR
jgi:predicted 3-demethylubiquinone-9 3-methyltransferase (glyoxalase superfamily)